MESKGKAFRRLLQDEPYLFTGGIYSPLDAQIAERAGMKSIYLSGYSVAMLNGWPDMGFLTQTEVTKIASMVASAVEVPIIADADDGNMLAHLKRTVPETGQSIEVVDNIFGVIDAHRRITLDPDSFRTLRTGGKNHGARAQGTEVFYAQRL